MIDWLQVVLTVRHSKQLIGGVFLSTDDEGVEEWRRIKAVTVEGSHSSKIKIASQNQCAESEWRDVYISGNPAKFLQGHNLFGSDDVLGLAAAMGRKALLLNGIFVPESVYQGWLVGEGIDIKMIDITYMWRLPTQSDARAWLRAMSYSSHMRRRGRGEMVGETLYYGKRSRRWAFKFYNKFDELLSKKKGHRLPGTFDLWDWAMDKKRLLVWAEGTVRGELRLLNMEIKRLQLDNGKLWAGLDTLKLYKHFLEGLEVAEQSVDDQMLMSKLSGARLRAYMQWRDGVDLRSTLTKPTFYRLRRELKQYGIDIAVAPAQSREHSNVVPMLRPLVAEPCATPDFAKGRRILFETERDRARRLRYAHDFT